VRRHLGPRLVDIVMMVGADLRTLYKVCAAVPPRRCLRMFAGEPNNWFGRCEPSRPRRHGALDNSDGAHFPKCAPWLPIAIQSRFPLTCPARMALRPAPRRRADEHWSSMRTLYKVCAQGLGCVGGRNKRIERDGMCRLQWRSDAWRFGRVAVRVRSVNWVLHTLQSVQHGRETLSPSPPAAAVDDGAARAGCDREPRMRCAVSTAANTAHHPVCIVTERIADTADRHSPHVARHLQRRPAIAGLRNRRGLLLSRATVSESGNHALKREQAKENSWHAALLQENRRQPVCWWTWTGLCATTTTVNLTTEIRISG